jgi:hypothetical protein
MKKLKYVKLFENFSENEKGQELYKFIDSLKVEKWIKDSLKRNEDLEIIWSTNYFLKQGIKDLMKLFEPSTVEYWNKYINELDQESYINSFYSGVDDYVEVLDRLNKYLKHPEVGYIMTEIFGYCNPVALRYMSNRAVSNILAHKDLIRKFQALWVTKLNIHSAHGSGGNEKIPSFNQRLTGIKPFVPTSDKEHEERIEEIIIDKYQK